MLKVVVAFQVGYMTCVRLFNIPKGFNEQALEIVHYGSVSVSLLLTVLMVRLKLSLVNYALFFLLAVRCAGVFVIMHLIDTSTPGFELIDKKVLPDAIP